VYQAIPDFPDILRGVVGRSISESSRSVELAQGIGEVGSWCAPAKFWKSALEGVEHGDECGSRVDCQGDIVDNLEQLEAARSADPPWFVVSRPVVRVQEPDDDDVACCESERDLWSQSSIVESLIDCEGDPE